MGGIVAELDQIGGGPVSNGLNLRTTLHPGSGCPRLLQQVLTLGVQAVFEGAVMRGGELWYLKRGSGRLEHGSDWATLHAGTGAFLPPKTTYRLLNDGDEDLDLTIVRLPAGHAAAAPSKVSVARLEDSPVARNGDRRFAVLIGPATGLATATQFVGHIPFGRAPTHQHTYDEVVEVLTGVGIVHLAGTQSPLAAGSCIYIPPGSPHCLENSGTETLSILGVFHPGGSPAAKAISTD
ncbi:MAG: cupin domain-containing protein [Candidatus Dormibacteria bacterium]